MLQDSTCMHGQQSVNAHLLCFRNNGHGEREIAENCCAAAAICAAGAGADACDRDSCWSAPG